MEHETYSRPTKDEALGLLDTPNLSALMERATILRDAGFGNVVTYSRKVFIPLTQLCRDVCHYCTFAQPPKPNERAYLTIDEMIDVARQGANAGCNEALFTLGDKPELRYPQAREELNQLGYATTIDYLVAATKAVLDATGLLPHANPGVLTRDELLALKAHCPSQGLMLENVSPRLLERGQVHFGSPDKDPEARLNTIRCAGELKIPFTSGILIGIGETRRERIDSLLALRDLNDTYGHIQEIIVQNFRAKPGTAMADCAEPSLDDLLWTIASARVIFGPDMAIQAPPNLSGNTFDTLLDAGLNDWGGVSPVTPDHVNPEAPWPHLDLLTDKTKATGKTLVERLTVYPKYLRNMDDWIDDDLKTALLQGTDADGFAREDTWCPGDSDAQLPESLLTDIGTTAALHVSTRIENLCSKASKTPPLSASEITELFMARGDDVVAILRTANELRQQVNGDEVTYVVNRNINYTNVCYFRCQFCAFSKGKQ